MEIQTTFLQRWRAIKSRIVFQKKLIASLFFLAAASPSWSQTTVSPSGGDANSPNGSVAYTVGQIDFVPLSGTNGKLMQGVQQPAEMFTGIATNKFTISASVYPNPTSDFTTLTIEKTDLKNLNYELFSIDGSLISSAQITNQRTIINTADLSKSIYFIKINYKNEAIKTFKLIKLN